MSITGYSGRGGFPGLPRIPPQILENRSQRVPERIIDAFSEEPGLRLGLFTWPLQQQPCGDDRSDEECAAEGGC